MNEKSNIIQQWVEMADHDLGTAKIVFQHLPDYYETVAFHCQQAVEKYLKALLIDFDIPFKRSHSLVYLLDLLSSRININQKIYDNAIRLNNFGVKIRYPDFTFFLTKQELIDAIEIAEIFRTFIIENIGKET